VAAQVHVPFEVRRDGGAPRVSSTPPSRRHLGGGGAPNPVVAGVRSAAATAELRRRALSASTNLSGRQRWRRATDNAPRGVMGAPQVAGREFSEALVSQRVATSTGHRRAAPASSQCFCSGRREQRAKLGSMSAGGSTSLQAATSFSRPHQLPSRPSGASRSASVIGGQATSAPGKMGGPVEASGTAAQMPRCLPLNRG
jgi:hypothetical protein